MNKFSFAEDKNGLKKIVKLKAGYRHTGYDGSCTAIVILEPKQIYHKD